jgi:hypothetical protein
MVLVYNRTIAMAITQRNHDRAAVRARSSELRTSIKDVLARFAQGSTSRAAIRA